jgi:hypothetical protein
VPAKGKASAAIRRRAKLTSRRRFGGRPSAKRSAATMRALWREGHGAASKDALVGRPASPRRSVASPRAAAAKKAVRTKGPRARSRCREEGRADARASRA